MLVDLNHSEILKLVSHLAEPDYNIYDNPIIAENGKLCGDNWKWNEIKLKKYSIEELWDIYVLCKNSWTAKTIKKLPQDNY